MLTIDIICIGKIKERYLQEAISEYCKRLSRYCKLNITELADEKIPDKINDNLSNQIKEKEGSKILSHMRKDSFIIALDLRVLNFLQKIFLKRLMRFLWKIVILPLLLVVLLA